MELILGEVQTNGKFLPLKGNPVWRSTEPPAVMWEPSACKDAAEDRVNVCLEATEKLSQRWKAGKPAAAKMAAKQTPAMFDKPLTKAQLLERFQSCLKWLAPGAAGRQAGRGCGRVPAIGKESSRGLRARLPKAQQGPARQPYRRASIFEHIAPRALQMHFFASSDPEN